MAAKDLGKEIASIKDLMQEKTSWDTYVFFLGQINSMDTKASSLLTLYTLVTTAYLALIAGFELFKSKMAPTMLPGILCLMVAVLMCARVSWTGDEWSSALVNRNDLTAVVRIRDIKTWFLSRSIVVYAIGLVLSLISMVLTMFFPAVTTAAAAAATTPPTP